MVIDIPFFWFHVILPIIDLFGDIYFSVNMFINGRLQIFGLSVTIIIFPIFLEYAPVIWDPVRRKNLREHMEALFSQPYTIYLGYIISIAKHRDTQLMDRFWKRKIIENLGESWFQAMLQTFILWKAGLPQGIVHMIIHIISIAASYMSIFSGICINNLRNKLNRQPTALEVLRFTSLGCVSIMTRFFFSLGVILMYIKLNVPYLFLVIIAVYVLPFVITLIIISPSIGVELYMLIDFEMYFFLACQHTRNMSILVKNRLNIKILILVYSFFSLATSCSFLYFISDWWCWVFGNVKQMFVLSNDCSEEMLNRTEKTLTKDTNVSCVEQHQYDTEQNIRSVFFG